MNVLSLKDPAVLHRIQLLHSSACLLMLLVWGAGCKPSAPSAAEPQAQPSAPPPPAEMVTIEGLNVGQISEAEQAWEELVKSLQAPPAPAEWETREPSPEELAAFELKLGAAAAEGAKRALVFHEKFPTHDKAKEAREQELELLSVAAELGQTNVLERLSRLETARLSDATSTTEDRLAIRIKQLQRQVKASDDSASSNSVAAMEIGVRAIQKDFPDRAEPHALMLSVADGWMTAGETGRAQNLATELAGVSLPDQLQEGVKRLQDRLSRLGKPVTFKTAGLDGKPLDLTALQGKVVLLYFWASWSANSISELPKLQKVFNELHPRGFEVVGISLDRERPELDQALADHKITWPQTFGPDAERLAEEFQIQTIPSLWLIDKKGNLRDVNARGNLAGRVLRLLDEK
jgi:peroxiredoxin